MLFFFKFPTELKPKNLALVPQVDMTTLVRYACNGKITECRDQFEEEQVPRLHPIFHQETSSIITKKMGIPLILTKIKISEMLREGMHENSEKRNS